MAKVPPGRIESILAQMEAEELAAGAGRRAIDLARFGACRGCGITLAGRWSKTWCLLCADQELPLLASDAKDGG